MHREPSAVDRLLSQGVVPVIRTSTVASARLAVEWLAEANYRSFELTMTIPGAIDLIRELRERPDFLIGAGTVLDPETAREVIAAGAKFLVSPALVPDIVAVGREHGVPVLMGGVTPTEILAASRAGSPVVKLFPASTVGPAHLKALKSVFPTIPIMPTGGIEAGNLADWFAAGAACVGVGGKLLDNKAIERGDRQSIIDAGSELLAALQRCRSGPV
jgi:2-dehydro-3-deoxyphosphogluconate aldolase/(4S)-4-hydroxy-2-oxoglutarate aldolase